MNMSRMCLEGDEDHICMICLVNANCGKVEDVYGIWFGGLLRLGLVCHHGNRGCIVWSGVG